MIRIIYWSNLHEKIKSAHGKHVAFEMSRYVARSHHFKQHCRWPGKMSKQGPSKIKASAPGWQELISLSVRGRELAIRTNKPTTQQIGLLYSGIPLLLSAKRGKCQCTQRKFSRYDAKLDDIAAVPSIRGMDSFPLVNFGRGATAPNGKKGAEYDYPKHRQDDSHVVLCRWWPFDGV